MAKQQNAAAVIVQAITGGVQAIDLKRVCSNIAINQYGGASDLYVEINGDTPSVGGATSIKIPAGGSWQSPQGENLAVQKFNVIGSAAAGTMQIVGV